MSQLLRVLEQIQEVNLVIIPIELIFMPQRSRKKSPNDSCSEDLLDRPFHESAAKLVMQLCLAITWGEGFLSFDYSIATPVEPRPRFAK